MSSRVVITGVAGALGSAVSALLRERGITTIGIDMSDITQTSDAEFFGGVDLTDEAAVQVAFVRVAEGGKINGLVNVAGGFCWETIADGSLNTWDKMFRMNVLTALNASRAALPWFSAGSAIVNVGAAAAAKAAAGMGAYTASKSGVARLTEALAEELKDGGIRVNAVLPSIIDTPANRKEMGDIDAHKWVTRAELASVIAFLLSDDASGITGASIPVTGRC